LSDASLRRIDHGPEAPSVSLARNEMRPFLLTMPIYGGTLAAARCLGERGIPVTMAGDSLLAPARWSRYVTRRLKAPPVLETERFLEWLLRFGEREPGHVLYPTSDELAWLVAEHRAELGRHYRLYQPGVEVMLRLLDKKALYEVCGEVGIDTPQTLFPASVAEAVRAGEDLGFPLLIKPRTQVLLSARVKGALVARREELAAAYSGVVASSRFHPGVRPSLAGLDSPMMQPYHGKADESIYSVAGFIGRGGQGIAARAARKILQRPRRVGVGLCFEEAPVDGPTLQGLMRLCRATGYFGVFEAEYVRDGSRLRMIDFNPRFYGQMALENARGLPLAYLVWLGASGQAERLAEELLAAQQWREGSGYVYANRFFLQMLLCSQRLTGHMPRAEVRRWRRWLSDHRRAAQAVDAAESAADRLPGLVSAAYELYSACRHPRYFMRQIVFNRD
jgi:predicted ATP-grasp superfamily ATP-dependent carboligase